MTSPNKQLWKDFSRDRKCASRETAPAHFIERVKERYGLDMTLEEYHALVNSKRYVGCFKKNDYNSIGVIKFKGIRIWCLYNNEYGLFTTALPPEVGTDSRAMATSCFAKAIHNVAFQVHDLILEELERERKDFSSIKEAALYYYSHSKFPSLSIDKYKHGILPTWRISSEIRRILNGDHSHVKLDVRRIAIETIVPEPSYNAHADLSE